MSKKSLSILIEELIFETEGDQAFDLGYDQGKKDAMKYENLNGHRRWPFGVISKEHWGTWLSGWMGAYIKNGGVISENGVRHKSWKDLNLHPNINIPEEFIFEAYNNGDAVFDFGFKQGENDARKYKNLDGYRRWPHTDVVPHKYHRTWLAAWIGGYVKKGGVISKTGVRHKSWGPPIKWN